ncbi:hypothetical protein F5884DRAFT_666306 [Xylogone sp. PMI_703]|nr:hypothetical protein F5884DRAFT_666306 [Xylogone sp. PMI_703]
MSLQQELEAWKSPKALHVDPVPQIGSLAPLSSKLSLPDPNGKPIMVTFLRHCGCQFAEKTFHQFRDFAGDHKDVNFIAISHSSQEATDNWVAVIGGEWDVTVIVDTERELYAQWGLGTSSTWHLINPWSVSSWYNLGTKEGIWNRPTESGNKWQTAGSFAVDAQGVIQWVKVAKTADDIPDFAEGLRALGIEDRKAHKSGK